MSGSFEGAAPPAVPGAFARAEGRWTLMGGFCPRCGRFDFPRPTYCRTCLEPVDARPVGSEGTLYSFTVVRMKPPLGLPQPYAVGYVDLAETGLRVFCLLDPARVEDLRVGLPVRLDAAALGDDGRGSPRTRPYFTPSTETEGSRG